jgi:SAM-dependent MidA family methyltransferase
LSLADRLRKQISSAGPITFHDWMAAALYDPADGYYCRADRQRWGRAGDYHTSPERSPLFAATFARYFASLYDALDRPLSWTIVEAGAGAGHFALGVLSTLQRRFPEVFAATTYVIDEVSESSSAAAKERLSRFCDRVEFASLASIATIDAGLIFSNELLDALPIHRVTRHEGQLREFYVTISEGGEFQWTLGQLSSPSLAEQLGFLGVQINEGQVVELNPGIEVWLSQSAAQLTSGYLVTVDYGAESPELYGSGREQGTLRGFRQHQFVDDVLSHPGEQDLTTTINWSLVRKLGEQLGLQTIEFERQDRFLLQAGLLEELEALAAESESDAERLQLRTASREMILPAGMAASFQVLVQQKLLAEKD